jgi:hypothetical protein
VQINRPHTFGKQLSALTSSADTTLLKGFKRSTYLRTKRKTIDPGGFIKKMHSTVLISKPIVNAELEALLPIYQQFKKLGEAHLSSEQLVSIRSKMASVSNEDNFIEDFELLMSRYKAFKTVSSSAEARLSRKFKDFTQQLPVSIISKLFVPSTADLTRITSTPAEGAPDPSDNILLQLANTDIRNDDGTPMTEIEKEQYLVLLAVLIGAPNAVISEIMDNASPDALSTNETITVAHMANSDDLFKLVYFDPETHAPKATFNKLDAILFSIYGGKVERARGLIDKYTHQLNENLYQLTNIYAAINMLQKSKQFSAGIQSEASRLTTELRERFRDEVSEDNTTTMRTPASITQSTESVDSYNSRHPRLSEVKGTLLGGASLQNATPDASPKEDPKDEPYSSGPAI